MIRLVSLLLCALALFFCGYAVYSFFVYGGGAALLWVVLAFACVWMARAGAALL